MKVLFHIVTLSPSQKIAPPKVALPLINLMSFKTTLFAVTLNILDLCCASIVYPFPLIVMDLEIRIPSEEPHRLHNHFPILL